MNGKEIISKEMNKCKHAIGGKINGIGEVLMFCELSDSLENVTLGECIGNCESQEGVARMNKQEIKNNCIMPEMPYCPCCKYGYVEHFEGNDTDTVWHCLKKEVSE